MRTTAVPPGHHAEPFAERGGGEYPRWIKAWFLLDAIAVLFPPLHWFYGRNGDVLLGIPVSVIYFISASLFITASIIAAYWVETAEGNFSDTHPESRKQK